MLTTRRALNPRPPDQVLNAYLSAAPLAHALFRAAETRHLAEAPLPPPVLDLGCGGGEFGPQKKRYQAANSPA